MNRFYKHIFNIRKWLAYLQIHTDKDRQKELKRYIRLDRSTYTINTALNANTSKSNTKEEEQQEEEEAEREKNENTEIWTIPRIRFFFKENVQSLQEVYYHSNAVPFIIHKISYVHACIIVYFDDC